MHPDIEISQCLIIILLHNVSLYHIEHHLVRCQSWEHFMRNTYIIDSICNFKELTKFIHDNFWHTRILVYLIVKSRITSPKSSCLICLGSSNRGIVAILITDTIRTIITYPKRIGRAQQKVGLSVGINKSIGTHTVVRRQRSYLLPFS